MVSRIELTNIEQENLLDYLKISFSESELHSLCNRLNMKKNDVFVQSLPPNKNCENFLEAIIQKDLVDELFILLQSPRFFRKRLLETFKEWDLQKQSEPDNLRKLLEIHIDKKGNSENFFIPTNWIAECKQKMVLILGKDSPDAYMKELERLYKLLEEIGYIPILIKKQNEIESITNEEKMLAYAALSRFIIIEKSYPSGQIVETKISSINRFPTIWLQKEGMGDTWMQGDYHIDQNSIQLFKYKEENVKEKLIEAVKWVEDFIKNKSEKLNEIYPWR
ncbi:hypothetical protein ICR95_28050 (plasmid) [Priestia megaterium]|uniref:hypothetical protein n=1 Tax=Priestia megaterium TaxID=1404 RepID=UPI00196B3FE4|nr:hypothetical protein [Priestia megaterium]QSF36395.1 hypothetical protein ICR95_28050 [Priestia megaterium]